MKEGDQITLWIEETPQTQVAIGSITTDEMPKRQTIGGGIWRVIVHPNGRRVPGDRKFCEIQINSRAGRTDLPAGNSDQAA
jgi:hypothetical protein